jgi:hypothetical protein
MSFAEFKAKSLRLVDSTISDVTLSPGTISAYNGNRITIMPTTIFSDGILTISNANLSGTTCTTVDTTDNSTKLATTAFVKGQVPNLTGYAQNTGSNAWTATQNFSTITASTPATSDNSSTVATTAFVKAQPAGLTIPIVLGTGVLTTLGQSILYSTTAYNKTFNSTERCFAPSGFLAVGSYLATIFVYANPATYNVAVYNLAASATQMTDNQTSGIDIDTYCLNDISLSREVNNVNINNGVLCESSCGVLNIVSSRPYISVALFLSGSTNNGIVQLKLARLS